MFKTDYQTIRAEATLAAMHRLTNCRDLPFKVAYNVMRMSKAIDIELRESQKKWLEIANKYIQKEILPDNKHRFLFDDGKPRYIEGVNVEEAEKAIADFNATAVLLDRFKLKVADIEAAKLTPAEMFALDFMLEE